MPEIVISNTSPLFYLHRLGHLSLLQILYRQIVVPDAVAKELKAGIDQGEDAPIWIGTIGLRFVLYVHRS